MELALEPIAETTGDPNSYGFRLERSTADAVKQGFNALCRECSAQWILEGDIKGCYDHISHDWIRHIRTDKTVLQKWLKSVTSKIESCSQSTLVLPKVGLSRRRWQI